MLRSIRDRLTYANVMATLAVFIALGGSSYAALKVGSKDIRNNSVRTKDLRNNDVRSRDIRNRTLTGRDVGRNRLGSGAVKESSLNKVPSARNADNANTLGGVSAETLKVRCPPETVPLLGLCFEASPSPPMTRGAAGLGCRTRGRRLPTYEELRVFFSTTDSLASGGEWTADVFESRATAGRLDTVVITSLTGNTVFEQTFSPSTRAYRCVGYPAN